jgi:hypothetical protein
VIKLTDNEVAQLNKNLEDAMEDLRTAVFLDTEDATFLTVGANVGLALQKLHDIRMFLNDRNVDQEMKKTPYPAPRLQMPDEDDNPWVEHAQNAAFKFRQMVDQHKGLGL